MARYNPLIPPDGFNKRNLELLAKYVYLSEEDESEYRFELIKPLTALEVISLAIGDMVSLNILQNNSILNIFRETRIHKNTNLIQSIEDLIARYAWNGFHSALRTK